MLHFNSIHPYSDNTVYTLWFLIDSSFRMSIVGASEGTNNQYTSSTYLPLIICGFTYTSESTTVCLPSNMLILVTDCVSGMWFCNTCTLGCVLAEAASFSSMQFSLPKKGGKRSCPVAHGSPTDFQTGVTTYTLLVLQFSGQLRHVHTNVSPAFIKKESSWSLVLRIIILWNEKGFWVISMAACKWHRKLYKVSADSVSYSTWWLMMVPHNYAFTVKKSMPLVNG